ncbi:dUTP diphosphatase [Woodsholea maritima]|uniref:dUTP diphosphatase n=1 Tax=Woodsholea maritima TaxID=240237 RepID=UPI000373AA12|nr:dUTP diphosphatase [Woodsholea maritima]
MHVPVRALDHFSGLELPAYQTAGSAGMDLRAAVPQDAPITIPSGQWRLIPTGLAMALPQGYEAQVRPRSGLAAKHGVTCLNTPGTVDADYRGEIFVNLINHGPSDFVVQRGERIAQMIIAPVIQIQWSLVDSLDDTERGSGGFGSTGV